jgi:ABC-2 type transport system permease protein
MHKVWLVVKREYITRVKTKAFLFTTIALPLLFAGYIAFVVVLARGQGDKTLKVAIVDEGGGLVSSVVPNLKEKLPNGNPAFEVVESFESPGNDKETLAGLRKRVLAGKLDAYLVIPRDAAEGKDIEYYTKNPGELVRTGSLGRAVSDAVITRRLDAQGIHVEDVSKLVAGVGVKLVKITEQGETEEGGETFIVGLVVVMVLYMTLLIYGVSTMRSVLEEKTAHIVEILVSSLRPIQLLLGKILGVAAVGLTQYLIWTVTGALVGTYGAALASTFSSNAGSFNLHIPPSLLIYMVIFFLTGYFLYASMFATIGAIVSSEQDAQQLQIPVMSPLILGIILLNVVLRNPSSTTSVVLSLIPFFAPLLMLVRIAFQTPPFWQIALSIGLLVVTTLGVVWFSARIYRVGILMYGKRPSLVEILRWLRYS